MENIPKKERLKEFLGHWEQLNQYLLNKHEPGRTDGKPTWLELPLRAEKCTINATEYREFLKFIPHQLVKDYILKYPGNCGFAEAKDFSPKLK